MRIQRILPALLVGLALAGLAGVSPADTAKAEDAKIEKLVEQLGSDTFAEREAATAALAKLGMPALEALRKGAASKDSEIRKRAKDILVKLEKEAASAEVLTPTRVHLVYKDTPLKEALEDLKKKTGAQIVLIDAAGKLKDTKVTLDTGKATFWDALEQFCDAAGVIEGTPEVGMVPGNPGGALVAPPGLKIQIVPAPVAPPARVPARRVEKEECGCDDSEDKAAEEKAAKEKADAAAKAKADAVAKEAAKAKAVAGVIRIQVGGAIAVPLAPAGFGMPGMAGMPGQPVQIALVPGKRAKVPTDASSSIRVRIGDKKKIPVLPNAKEIDLVLEVSPEPKLRWQSLVGVTIDKAVDDNGTKLKQVVAKAANGAQAFPAGGVIVLGGGGRVWRGGMMNPMGFAGIHQYVPVKFEKGDKASKSLAELSGTIAAYVQLPAEAMLTVDNLAKAKGKGVKGKAGSGELEVTSYTKADDGTVTIHFTFTQPENVTPETQLEKPVAIAPPGGAPAFPGALPGNVLVPMWNVASFGLTLHDDKGNVLPVSIQPTAAGNRRPFGGAGGTMDFIATYRPVKGGAAEPAKLVFTGRRTALVDIPFSLKKVALD